jgi:hypothetical protein
MDRVGYLEYRVNVFRDPETGRVVGEVPALGIATTEPTPQTLWLACAT